MNWLRRLHRLTTALLALLVVVVAIAAPDLAWSAAPEMGTSAHPSTSQDDSDEDVPSNGETEVEDDRGEFLDAAVPVKLPIRHASGLRLQHQLLGAPPPAFVRRATPPPEA